MTWSLTRGNSWGLHVSRVLPGQGPGRRQTLPPPGTRTTVRQVDAPDTAVGAGHAARGRGRPDPADQARLRQLAEEQAALRRVATLVARGTPPEQVFAAVAEEIGHLLSVDVGKMCRYNPDRTITFLASWDSAGQRFAVHSTLALGGHNLGTLVYETGRPGRIESYADDSSIGAVTVKAGVRSAVGTPIPVEGRLWGVIGVGSSLAQPLPPDAEERLASFTELVATAIANAESRA